MASKANVMMNVSDPDEDAVGANQRGAAAALDTQQQKTVRTFLIIEIFALYYLKVSV